MKVLLPVDVMHPYKDLVRAVGRIVPTKTADIKLLYVAESSKNFEPFLSAAGKSASELDNALHNKANSVLSQIAEFLTPTSASVTTQVAVGSPATVIEAIRRQDQFDVIAMGGENTEFQDQHPLGSTASNVVKHAHGTIAIMRSDGVDGRPFHKALVALDGSEQALNALSVFVRQFAVAERGIEIALVNIVSIVGIWKFVSPTEFIASIEDNLNMAGEAILADGEKALSEFGLKPSEMFIRTGDVAPEIIRAAKDVNADAIVCGAQGKGEVEKIIMGSSSYKLSRRSPLPLVIVK